MNYDIQEFRNGADGFNLRFDDVDYKILPDSISFVGGRRMK